MTLNTNLILKVIFILPSDKGKESSDYQWYKFQTKAGQEPTQENQWNYFSKTQFK